MKHQVWIYKVLCNGLSTIKDCMGPAKSETCILCCFCEVILCCAGITDENEFHTSSSPTLCVQWRPCGHAHSLCSETTSLLFSKRSRDLNSHAFHLQLTLSRIAACLSRIAACQSGSLSLLL